MNIVYDKWYQEKNTKKIVRILEGMYLGTNVVHTKEKDTEITYSVPFEFLEECPQELMV